MDKRDVRPGDFVWISRRNTDDKSLFAIGSIRTEPILQIIIYPLDNQTRESALIKRNNQWVVEGAEDEYTSEFVPSPGYYSQHGRRLSPETAGELLEGRRNEFGEIEASPQYIEEPNIDDLDTMIDMVSNSLTSPDPDGMDEIGGMLSDSNKTRLSEMKVTREQVIEAIQRQFLSHDSISPRFNYNSLTWVLDHGISPPKYNLHDFMLTIGPRDDQEVFDLLDRLHSVGQPDNDPYNDISYYQEALDGGYNEGYNVIREVPGVAPKFAAYFVSRGYPVPDDYNVPTGDPVYIRAIQILQSRINAARKR